MESEIVKNISKSCEDFSMELYKNIAASERNSIVVSPFGAHMLLAMAAYGADQNTASQMKKGLRLSDDDSENLQGFQALNKALKRIPNIEVLMANKIFVSNEFDVKSEFQSVLEDHFDSGCQAVDFSDGLGTAAAINEWCSEKTQDNITAINKETKLMLVNAIHFQAEWEQRFNEKNTELQNFYVDEETTIQLETMHQEKLKYTPYGELEDFDAKFAELSYCSMLNDCLFQKKKTQQNENFTMVIIVPNKINGLKELENNLEKITYDRLTKCATSQTIEIFLPKFKVESTIDIGTNLEKMGMTEMFSKSANFNKIVNEHIKIDQIVQKAIIEIDEKGTKASAVGRVLLQKRKFEGPPKIILRADRPFLTIIMYEKIPLFYARFTG